MCPACIAAAFTLCSAVVSGGVTAGTSLYRRRTRGDEARNVAATAQACPVRHMDGAHVTPPLPRA